MSRKPKNEDRFSGLPVEDAAFARALMRLVEGEFALKLFTKPLYRRLNSMFGFIAHYDLKGFYATQMSSTWRRRDFLQQILSHPSYGPHASLERAIREWIRDGKYVLVYEERFRVEKEAADRAQYEELKKRFG